MIIDFIGKKLSQGNLEVGAQDGRAIQLAVTNGDILNIGLNLGLQWEGSRLSRTLEYQEKLSDLLVQVALPKFVDENFQVPVDK